MNSLSPYSPAMAPPHGQQATPDREHILLLHASASSARQWQTLQAQLAGAFEIHAPDLFGYGSAPGWPGNTAIRMTHEAERAASLAPVAPCHVVGHSFGGAVALRLATEQPERIRSLVLIEPAAFHLLRDGGEEDCRLYREITRVAADVTAAVLSGNLQAGAARFIDYWNGTGAWVRLGDSAREAIAARLPSVALNFRAALTERLPISVYATTAAPIHLIQGEHSPRPTRRINEMLARVFRNCARTEIAGAGHMSPISHPDDVHQVLSRHLATSSRPAWQAA